MMSKLIEKRNDKKEHNKKTREDAQKICRKIPTEILAKAWLKEGAETAEARAFLVDKVLPTLILGMEKLLMEVDQRGLAEKELDANFNPINMLAQYLMRNNPKYSNFSEASPYIRGLREVGEQLKQELFDMDENRLVRIKADARRRREEREAHERNIHMEKRRREYAINNHFKDWIVTGAYPEKVELALLQNALRSFNERSENMPAAIRASSGLREVEPTDDTGRALVLKEFVEYMHLFVDSLSSELFDQLMLHMQYCAHTYRAKTERDERKTTLSQLFVSCDHSGIGVLDRHRILDLFSMFYDKSLNQVKEVLRNPRKWPVVQMEEEASEDEEEGESTKQNDKPKQQTKPDNKEGKAFPKPVASSQPRSEDKPPQTQQSRVSFVAGTAFTRERSLLTAHGTRSHSQASMFDENLLNVSQFVHVTETFMGEVPDMHVFGHLVRYIREGYMETEEERMGRLLQARREAMEQKRKALLNSLFEMWDNDGSGMLDMDEVDLVMKKYKDGMDKEAIVTARGELKKNSKHGDKRLSKREFRAYIDLVVAHMGGERDSTFDFFVEFLISSVERTYQERVRGEARKKWLQQIVTAAETGGASMEPVYKALFQALYKDAENHGGGKKISAYIAMLETNQVAPSRGQFMLRYTAATPSDADFLLGRALFSDMKGISFATIESGKPIHVPRVAHHGNIHFWNPNRDMDRDGSFLVVPLKDKKNRVFGILGIDTLCDPQSRAIFITHEIQFFQGIAKAFSIAYHHVDVRQKTMRISESAIGWIHRRCLHVRDIAAYMVEPDAKSQDFLLRKMITTDEKGNAHIQKNPARFERKDNLFRDYLFKCVDNSESVTADAYGERHMAFPLRDNEGRAIVAVDISLKPDEKTLPKQEMKEVMKMLRLLQMAYKQISQEAADDGAKTEDSSKIEILFDRLMLMELKENVAKLDAKAYAELKSYKEPPPVVHNILKAVLSVFNHDKAREAYFDDWNKCKNYVNPSLSHQILQYDPTTNTDFDMPVEVIHAHLEEVPHGEVSKHGSIPAQYLYNWVFVCVSLVEHTRKMAANKKKQLLADAEASEETPPQQTDEGAMADEQVMGSEEQAAE